MTRLVHLSSSRVPSRAANSIQVMRTASAFAAAGLEVTLWHEAGDPALGDPFAWYGVEPRFRLRTYPDRDAGFRLGRRLGRRLTDHGFSAYLGLVLRPDLVYGRSLRRLALWLRSPWSGRARTGVELHEPPRDDEAMRLLREIAASPRLAGLVVVSDRLRERLLELLPGFPPARVLAARNAVDAPPAPPRPATTLEGRFRLGYAGGLHPGTGLEVVAEAIRGLDGVVLHVLGGTADEREVLRPLLPEEAAVRWHGPVAPGMVPGWLAACDLLVAPYGPDARGHRGVAKADWMSPLKLFEYAAASRPILASDLPAIREILADEETALLAAPLDPTAWRRAILRLRDDPALGSRLAASALAELRAASGSGARIGRILAFLGGAPATA